MIEIHAHLLFGVDDGPETLEEALDILRMAEAHGIQKMCATSHVLDRVNHDVENHITDKFNQLYDGTKKEDISIELILGAEVYFRPDLEELLNYSFISYGDQKKYVLVEFSMNEVPLHLTQMIKRMKTRGVTLIIAHPERNREVRVNPEMVEKWIEAGALLQANAGSITGSLGVNAQKTVYFLLNSNAIHFVASDAHNTRRRTPRELKDAHVLCRQRLGTEVTNILFSLNPQRMLDGEDIHPATRHYPEKEKKTGIRKWFNRLTKQEYR